MASTRPVIDYTSRSYAELRDDMLAHASTLLPQWTSRSPNDFGVVFVELFAYMGDILNFYADRIANEAFLSTATQRSSVLQLARLLDYRPDGATAAKALLTFGTAPGLGAVTIPAGSRVSTLNDEEDPVFFETDVDLIVPGTTADPDSFTGTVLATEGTTVFETVGQSDGLPGQDFILTQNPVIEGSLDVFMDEGSGQTVVWQWVDHLIEWGSQDRVFTTYTDENNVLHVQFGDGVNGKVPSSLTLIQTGYRVGGGALGNVGPGTLTTLDSTITGVISVTNTSAAYGGQDAETLDQIRVAAPQALISLNRAVTLADYEALSKKVVGVSKAKALSAVYSSVTLYVAPLGGGLDSSEQPIYLSAPGRTAVQNFLSTRVPAPTTVTLADPTYVKIDITLDLVVAPQYNRATVDAAVKQAILATLAFDAVDFGYRVTVGKTFSAINSVIGVGYGTLIKLARVGNTGTADVQLSSNEIPVPGLITLNTTGGILT